MSSRPVKSSKRFTFCDEFSAARRLRLPDSRRRCRRRSAFCPRRGWCPGRDVCDPRRSFEPPGEKRSFEGNPGRCGLRARGPGSSFPFLYRPSETSAARRRDRAHAVALTSRRLARRRGLVGETWFPPRVTERAGFEPATHLSARTRFPVALLRPLGHLSVLRSGEGGIRTLDGGIHPHNALAGRRLQPLGHFSAGPRRIADCFPQDGCAGDPICGSPFGGRKAPPAARK